MKRSIIVAVAIVAALAAAAGGLAARRYLITSSRQVKPGAIAYRDLNRFTRRLIARNGRRGRRGSPGREGVAGPQGAAGGRGPAGASGATGPAGPAGPEGPSGANELAEASGLVAWTTDPGLISTSRQDSSGTIHGGSVWLEQGQTIHWLAEFLTRDGSDMTIGQFAIYDSSLGLQAETANDKDAFESAPAGSWVKLSLTKPYTVPASGLYYLVDFLAGSSTPTIGVAVYASGLAARNDLPPSGVPRAVRDGSGLQALPETLTLSSTDETRCVLAG